MTLQGGLKVMKNAKVLTVFLFFDRSSLHGVLKANGRLYGFKEETWTYVNAG